MTNPYPQSGDGYLALVRQHHAQYFRLALLVAGDLPGAERLTEQSYQALPDPIDIAEGEQLLVRGLLAARPTRWHWQASPAMIERAALDRRQAAALLALLARYTPAERLAIGLHHLRGMAAQPIAAWLEQPGETTETTLAHFRCAAVGALGLLPAGPTDDLEQIDHWLDGRLADDEALAVRRSVLADPQARAQRDALLSVRTLLARAMPALFSEPPPLRLSERLIALGQPAPPPSAHRLTGAALWLCLGVLVVVLAIIFGPALLPQPSPSGAQPGMSAAALLDAAIHRFDRAPLTQGVLHERYRVQLPSQQPYQIERWYDYATPHRLTVTMGRADRPGRFESAYSTNGRDLIQYRYTTRDNGYRGSGIDLRVAPEQAQQLLPLLRGRMSAALFVSDIRNRIDPAALYLGQARAAGATLLGDTQALGRPALLLAYQTDQPPLQPTSGQTHQVLLTIDAQTYGLIQVAVVPLGSAEGITQITLQADQFELLPKAPDALFALPPTRRVIERSGPISVSVPFLPPELFRSLEELRRHANRPVLVPQQLPDTQMRGLAISGNDANAPVLMYEGEFQTVLINSIAANQINLRSLSDVREAGDYQYWLIDYSIDEQLTDITLAAQIVRPDTPNQQFIALLVDAAATPAEREASLAQLIASLTPLTAQNTATLQRNFSPAPSAGGQ